MNWRDRDHWWWPGLGLFAPFMDVHFHAYDPQPFVIWWEDTRS